MTMPGSAPPGERSRSRRWRRIRFCRALPLSRHRPAACRSSAARAAPGSEPSPESGTSQPSVRRSRSPRAGHAPGRDQTARTHPGRHAHDDGHRYRLHRAPHPATGANHEDERPGGEERAHHLGKGGLTVTEMFAREMKRSPQEVGFYRIRPPLKPLTVRALAGAELV